MATEPVGPVSRSPPVSVVVLYATMAVLAALALAAFSLSETAGLVVAGTAVLCGVLGRLLRQVWAWRRGR